MSQTTTSRFGVFAILAAGFLLGCIFTWGSALPENELVAAENEQPNIPVNHVSPVSQPGPGTNAQEDEAVSPVKARARETYYPNTEDLKPDEMRVIACGTGMPTTRAFQAAACFLVELGNGDKFLFDCGSGAAERISSLQIPYNYLDKVLHWSPAQPITLARCTICSLAAH